MVIGPRPGASKASKAKAGVRRRVTFGVVVLFLAAGLALRVWKGHRPPVVAERPAHAPKGDPWKDFPAGTFVTRPFEAPDAGAPVDWFSKNVTPNQVDDAMKAWRQAILDRQKDTVLTLDEAFTLLPGLYGPALLKSAQTDDDERVRAFSTRVLGKFRNPRLVGDFMRLLADKSPFVRENAAWALGELAKVPGGRGLAQEAVDALRQVAGDDPATQVKAAATNALRALQ